MKIPCSSWVGFLRSHCHPDILATLCAVKILVKLYPWLPNHNTRYNALISMHFIKTWKRKQNNAMRVTIKILDSWVAKQSENTDSCANESMGKIDTNNNKINTRTSGYPGN